jgi:hypothetical protein
MTVADPHLSVCRGSEPNWLVHERGIEPHILVFDKSKRTGSQWTLRWREMDSNLRFPNISAPVFETAVPSPMTV